MVETFVKSVRNRSDFESKYPIMKKLVIDFEKKSCVEKLEKLKEAMAYMSE